MDKLRFTQVNPIPVIVGAALVVLALGYFFWLRPMQQEAKIKKEWTTDEAASKRGPGRVTSQAFQDKVKALLEKEGKGARPINSGANRP